MSLNSQSKEIQGSGSQGLSQASSEHLRESGVMMPAFNFSSEVEAGALL